MCEGRQIFSRRRCLCLSCLCLSCLCLNCLCLSRLRVTWDARILCPASCRKANHTRRHQGERKFGAHRLHDQHPYLWPTIGAVSLIESNSSSKISMAFGPMPATILSP